MANVYFFCAELRVLQRKLQRLTERWSEQAWYSSLLASKSLAARGSVGAAAADGEYMDLGGRGNGPLCQYVSLITFSLT